MKYNKGFAPLILLAIIVGALAVGGGAVYFATKTPTSPKNVEENNYQPQENQNQNPLTTITDITTNAKTNNIQNQQVGCNSNSLSTVKVLSPNGGETFSYNQKINVKWNSCNIKTNSMTSGLKNIDSGKEYHIWAGNNTIVNDEQNIGSAQELSLLPGNYKAFICNTKRDINLKPEIAYTNLENYCSFLDYSDNSFSIQKPTQNQASVTTWKIYKGQNFEIKYPSDWKIGFAEESVFFDFPDVNYNLGARFEVSDSVGDINYWVKEFIKDNTPFVQNDITIDNLPAKKVSFTGLEKHTFYHVGKGDIGFRMFPSIGEYITDPIEINKIQNIFEEMAFSFKFK